MPQSTVLPPDTLLKAARLQLRIVGALMLRELHTRFGRHNIGYLWLIGEPLILSLGITLAHLFTHTDLPYGFQPASFYAAGYITFITFRNNVNRSVGTIEANKTLMYHRRVTLLDITLGRAALDGLAPMGAMLVVLLLVFVLGLAELPQRPWLTVLALVLMAWYATGWAMIISSCTELFGNIVERFVHPATYLIIPVSGMFFILDQFPPDVARKIAWFPVPQITDLARMGIRSSYDSPYVNMPYILWSCAGLTLVGLSMLRLARSRMHFE